MHQSVLGSVGGEELAGSAVKVCTVVGFPLGANTTERKWPEPAAHCAQARSEIDMVINVGELHGRRIPKR